jgi:hypothetical protein
MNLWLALVLAATPARSVDGGLTEAEIADVFELHAADFAPCFEKAKQRKKASVKYRFEVTDGRVTKMAFVDSQLDGAGTTCVGAQLEKTRFPSRQDAGTSAEWTFTLPAAQQAISSEVATPDQLAPLDEIVSGCYGESGPSEQAEGTIAVELELLRSGAIASASVTEQSKALNALELEKCLRRQLPTGLLATSEVVHRVRADWLLATSERRAKKLFIPSEPRREIVPTLKAAVRSSGGLDGDAVMKVITAGNSKVHRCYESSLALLPKLEGKVAIEWTVGPDGRVIAATVDENTVNESSVAKCVLAQVKTWRFPNPEGGKTVSLRYAWIFTTGGR